MHLRSIRIENYRAIREGSVSLEETTILIGENDSGRSSVIEALMLVLGPADANFEARIKPFHFHRRADGTTGPLRVILHIDEESPGRWLLPDSIQPVFPSISGKTRAMEFEFRAALDGTTDRVSHSCYMKSADSAGPALTCSPDVLDWLRKLIPVLWLRFGLLAPESELSKADTASNSAVDPLLTALALRYRNLVTGNTPDITAEIEQGARAAQAVMEKYPHVFAGAVPMMGAMVSEILNPRPMTTAAFASQGSTNAHKIGLLLLLGSLLQLAHRTLLPGGRPVLVIENPESNLHPITLATVWRVIERLAWQKVIATNSGTLLSNAPLSSIRRLTRSNGKVSEWSVPSRMLSRDNLRRVSYHLRSRRSSAMFARCWLMVEGETEYWVVPELARVCGFDLSAEGVACVEFAQCGLAPLIKMAHCLGIAWHVLVDGDEAGRQYSETACSLIGSRSFHDQNLRVTRLREKDVEHCFWNSGFADVIQRVANSRNRASSGSATATIRKAIDKTSKPYLALSLVDAVAERGPESVPTALREMVKSAVTLARMLPGSRS
jgi:putative ATP-dependent endonuclease of the OLD family